MSAMDPLSTVRDALDAGGYGPHGQPHDFRSRCPGHDGDNADGLHVSIGADGRALLHCFARQSDAAVITSALGLGVPDLFPAGHRGARRIARTPTRRADFAGNARDAAAVLAAVDRLGEDWRVEIALCCPDCGDGRALFVASRRHASFVSCPEACTATKVAEVFAARLVDRSKA